MTQYAFIVSATHAEFVIFKDLLLKDMAMVGEDSSQLRVSRITDSNALAGVRKERVVVLPNGFKDWKSADLVKLRHRTATNKISLYHVTQAKLNEMLEAVRNGKPVLSSVDVPHSSAG